MEYLPSYKDDLYLAHHGILGQKWGVRRFQNSDGSLTRAGRARYGNSENSTKSNNKLKTAAKVAGAATAVGLAGMGAYAISKSGMPVGGVHNISELRKPGLPILTQRDSSMATAAIKVNPNAKSGNDAYLFNCTHCSVAYDLRRRGYDVEAGPGHVHLERFMRKAYAGAEYHTIPGISSGGGAAAKDRELSIKNLRTNLRMQKQAQKQAIDDPQGFARDQRRMTDNILKQCEDMGPGARGAINLTLANGMGHCIAFECDEKGQAHLIDSQLIATTTGILGMGGAHGTRGSSYVDDFIAKSILPCMPVSVTRYDNAEPNIEFLKKKRIVVPSEG